MNKWHAIRLWVLVFTLISTAGIVFQVSAAPAAPIEIQISQPDGTTFTVRQWGDEWQNGLETVEGYTILQGDDGWWSYAALDSFGNLSPVLKPGGERRLAGIDSPDGLSLHIRPEKQPSLQGAGEASGLHAQNSGSQPVLVLLVEFSDWTHMYSPTNFASSFFGANGSVKDFYLKASFNKLTLAPATESYNVGGADNDGVIGWLNLGYPHPNTAGNTGIPNQQIVKDALIAADPYINYKSYDKDGNGYIAFDELHIVAVVAGFERSYDNHSPSIWAHRWSLNGVTPPYLDNVVLGDFYHSGGYAQFGEIHGNHQATIGVMAHEFGHDLTWPDLYDTDGSSEGVGEWSIMGSGSWNSTTGYYGSVPALPDAWLKWYQGWINPVPVNGVLSSVMISQSATNPTAYLLGNNPFGVDWDSNNHSGSGEYFLVENRNYTGYDAGLPGCGLLITHIDESVSSGNVNELHPLVKIIEADGKNDLVEKRNRGDTGDPFPGSTNNNLFGYNTTPNSHLYNGEDSQVEVSTTSLCGSSMSTSLRFGNPISYTNFVYLPLITNGGTSAAAKPVRNGDF